VPNTIKATNLTVTKTFEKFFIATNTFKKFDGSEGKQSYKIWTTQKVSINSVINVIGSASGSVLQFTDKNTNEQVTVGQLSINAKEIEVVSLGQAPQAVSSNWDTF
jgi:hypothetical protein